jgi:hypothetical protein
MRFVCTIRDRDGSELEVTVQPAGSFLNILPKGYGNPVSLDYHHGRLELLLNTSSEEETPQVLDLEGAREAEQGEPTERALDAAKLDSACRAALDALRRMYGRMEGGDEAEDLLSDETLWPLTQLREALGE